MNPVWNVLVRPMLSRSNKSGGSSSRATAPSVSKMALVLATALTIGSTTVAFATKRFNPVQKTRRERNPWTASSQPSQIKLPLPPASFLLPFQFTQSVQCEAQPTRATPLPKENSAELLSSTTEELTSSGLYERINPPSRMEEHSHAVGQLLQPNKIERYEIYRKRDTATAASTQTTTTSPSHIVTALVQFGDSLDGHPGIVHGGIMALVLDDIFGFSFHTIGVPMAVTANLSLDYRASMPANSSVVIQVYLQKRENRKLYFKADVMSLDGEVLYTEATCLYIIPSTPSRNFARMIPFFKFLAGRDSRVSADVIAACATPGDFSSVYDDGKTHLSFDCRICAPQQRSLTRNVAHVPPSFTTAKRKSHFME